VIGQLTSARKGVHLSIIVKSKVIEWLSLQLGLFREIVVNNRDEMDESNCAVSVFMGCVLTLPYSNMLYSWYLKCVYKAKWTNSFASVRLYTSGRTVAITSLLFCLMIKNGAISAGEHKMAINISKQY
jgi:hypothetical protein